MNSQGVNTSSAPLINAPEQGASPFRFQGTTLTDWLRAADPRTRFLSNERGEPLAGGSAAAPIGREAHHTDRIAPGVVGVARRGHL